MAGMSLGVHAGYYAWLAALAVPLVILYFLKLKRERTEVPALLLWRAVMEDRRVNSPFQRFKRNILLLLQLLLLLFLCLAAIQPFLKGGDANAGRMPILIDCSASMGALTKPGGPSRLDEAKKMVRERIDNLGSGEDKDGKPTQQQLCLIAFGRDARRLTGFTGDKRELRDALDRLEVEDAPSDPTTALQLAQALARSSGFERAELVTDGNLPERVDVDLAFKIDYRRIDAPAPNLGITACDARRRPDGRWEVFIAVTAAAQAPASATLELRSGDELLQERPLQPHPGAVERVSFAVPGEHALALEARLRCDGFDALAADDRAYLALPPLRPLRVWVPPALRTWRRALVGVPGIEIHPGEGAADDGGAYDLAISDKAAAPAALVTAYDGAVPESLRPLVDVAQDGSSSVVDWRRSDPLLAHAVLEDLVVSQRVQWATGAGEKDLEALGWEVLVHGDRGPLLARRSRGGALDVALLFRSDRSTLPYRVAFPVLAANLAAAAMQAAGQSETRCLATGVLPALGVAPLQPVAVTGPNGLKAEATSDSDGIVGGLRAPRAGLYRIAGGGKTVDLGVALLSPAESSLASVDQVRFREIAVQAAAASIPGERALWRALALAALLVCLAEWWYFHRRPFAPSV
jgi:hypothetical protein